MIGDPISSRRVRPEVWRWSLFVLAIPIAGCTRAERPLSLAERGVWVTYEGDGGCRWFPAEEWARLTAETEKSAAVEATDNEAACRDGDHSACSLVASQYDEGRGVVRSPAIASVFYQRAAALEQPLCARGDPFACDGLSAMHAFGGGTAVDARGAATYGVRAYRLFSTACERGDGNACRYQAQKLFGGDHVEKDRVLANRLYQRAVALLDPSCESGSAESCDGMFAMFANGDGVTKDTARAEAALARARVLWGERCARDGNRAACRRAEKLRR